MIHDAAVIIPTTLAPSLARAVRSVYAQDLDGTVQIMVGIDVARGSRDILETLQRECPPRRTLTVIDLGYSTSTRHGGFYPNWSGGGLRTILSFAANSRYLAYLDDDNWWDEAHLSDLLTAVRGHAWAYSLRWYVDPDTQQPMCIDEWESVGPGKGMYGPKFGGFVDTNCLLMDKRKCHWVLPAWCIPGNRKGAGIDRVVFRKLRRFPGACTGRASAYYVVREGDAPRIRAMIERRQAQETAAPAAAGSEAGPAR